MRFSPPRGTPKKPPGKPLWASADLARELGVESGRELGPMLRAAGIKPKAMLGPRAYYDPVEVRKWWASR